LNVTSLDNHIDIAFNQHTIRANHDTVIVMIRTVKLSIVCFAAFAGLSFVAPQIASYVIVLAVIIAALWLLPRVLYVLPLAALIFGLVAVGLVPLWLAVGIVALSVLTSDVDQRHQCDCLWW
jgi:hypothetical protein